MRARRAEGLAFRADRQQIGATIVQASSHTPIVVGSGRQSVQRAEFRCVNTVISNLKTAISGTYHSFKFNKYIHGYLAEVQYRFNRRYDLKAILARLLRVAVLTGPRTGARYSSG